MDQTPNAPVSTEAAQTERKTYNSPMLIDFGSFAEITQGVVGLGFDAIIFS